MKKILLISLLGLISANCAPVEDLVKSLPNMTTFSFPMYSGYLDIEGKGKHLHYIFAYSQKDPSKDPLLVWYNGGPGCSSMLGFLQEHGPWVMEDETDFFHENEYSWNNETNIVYIESPAGVGYSYCDNKEDCIYYNDYNSSAENIAALESFFKKFPEFSSNDLYISGESYAGVYVPHVAWRIYNWNMDPTKEFKFNLKGFLVGNPVTDWEWDGDAAWVKMSYYFNLYGNDFKKKLADNNCTYLYYDVPVKVSDICEELFNKTFSEKYVKYLNVYDMYRRCFTAGAYNDTNRYGEVTIDNEVHRYKKVMSPRDYTPWLYNKDFMRKAPSYMLKNPPPGPPPDNPLGTCEFGIPYIDWANNATTKDLLHISPQIKKWESCIDFNYTQNIEASEWIYEILKGKIKILVYSGDTDGSVPTYGTWKWIKKINWKIKEEYRPYFVDGQVAGYVEERDGLTFATVHGCGHMAPQWKRPQNYHLVFNWIKNEKI